jgi:ElaB/YqjD/DUF883 family membrane-anchored ribosome-binding protein
MTATAKFGNTRDAASDVKAGVLDDVNSLVESARDTGNSALTAAADRISAYYKQLSEKACDLTAEGKKATLKAVDTTDAYVKDNPWQAIAMCAGLAFIIGLMANRR